MCEASTKTCSRCGEEKPLLAFRPQKAACKDCVNAQSRERRKANGYAISDDAREAKRARDRERGRRPDVRERKRLARLRYQREKILPVARVRAAEKRTGAHCLIYLISCAKCGASKVTRDASRVYCSKRCSASMALKGRQMPLTQRECKACGVLFDGKAAARYCDACGKARYREQSRLIKRKMDGKSIQERARKHGCKREPIWRIKVYERDRWKCYLCGRKVVRSNTYRPNQATIDHVIPLSKGGSHTYDNVRTSCQSCNSSKGDKIMNGVQLSIFTNG